MNLQTVASEDSTSEFVELDPELIAWEEVPYSSVMDLLEGS